MSRASQTTPVGVQPASKSGARIARLPGGCARAIRDLSSPAFVDLLRYLGPEQLPAAFCRAPRDESEFPLGQGFADHFNRIINYCDPRCGPRGDEPCLRGSTAAPPFLPGITGVRLNSDTSEVN
jgi:hypothetical protein